MKLSLILTTKNRARYLERALAALIREKKEGYPNIEIVITDAGSTDGTVDIIRKNEAFIDKWLSKPDSGVSEGVNRALSLATGDVVWMTGDDDIIVPGASIKMMAYLRERPHVDVVFAQNIMLVETTDGLVSPNPWPTPKTIGPVTKRTICQNIYASFLIPESAFFRKPCVDKVRGYNQEFHYFAFWDFLFRLKAVGAEMVAISEVVINHYSTPLSDAHTALSSPRWAREHETVIYRHGGLYWLVWHRCHGRITASKVLDMIQRKLGAISGIHPRRWWERLFG